MKKILQKDWEKELKDLTENNEGELNVAFPLMDTNDLLVPFLTYKKGNQKNF